MAIRTVEEALAALSQLTNFERTRADGPRDFGLERPLALLRTLGSPERRIGARVVQVAGTKGKGSTARFVDGCLRAAGVRTGLFLSPHLVSVRERISVDGAWIPEEDFARQIGAVLDAVDGTTTFFEALLAAACLHFAERGTEAVVLEVGLGGRLDATTAVPATHTIITGIGLEHTEILGTTPAQIAAEKAGTIRFGVPVWSGVPPVSEAGSVIRAACARSEAPYTYVPPPADVAMEPDAVVWGSRRLPVLGAHQAHNAALAAAACHDLPRAAIDAGLAATGQPGCCERRGDVIVDGAHTLDSIAATLRAMQQHRPGVRPVLLFALAGDKDFENIPALLAQHVADVICTCVDEKRGREARQLASHPAWKQRARAIEPLEEALQAARAASQSGNPVLATGSMYLAGALRPLT